MALGEFEMSSRIPGHGGLVNSSKPLTFQFNGKELEGFQGDTLASALLANNQLLIGRSFKYHRPRGLVASGAEEPNGLVGLGEANAFEPNARATTTELFDGLVSCSQNHWPSLEFDIGYVNNYLSSLLPAGFYYKTFIHPRPAWKYIFEPIIRKSAGLGKPTKGKDPDKYEHFYAYVDVLIVGGGISGLYSAKVAAKSGARVLLIEQTPHLGGQASIDNPLIDQGSIAKWITELTKELEGMNNVTIKARTVGVGVYDHGYSLAYERLTDHELNLNGSRHRLWKIRAKQIITATGAIERPLSFANNDVPGVMLASAVRNYLTNYGVSIGDRTVVVTNNDDAYRTAISLKNAGLSVPLIIDSRPSGAGELAKTARDLGIRIENGKAISIVHGKDRVKGISLCDQVGSGTVLEEISCDAVAMSGGWSPVVHLWSHCGGKLNWDNELCAFRPDTQLPPTGVNGLACLSVVGSANGDLLIDDILRVTYEVTLRVIKELDLETNEAPLPSTKGIKENSISAVWKMPYGASTKLKSKTWLDFQNDVKVTDVELAAQEGFESVEHAKRYTTLGMATDQGKLSNINGLAILSESLHKDIPSVGTTTFRPPYSPISMGSIAGEARSELFQPIRKTPMHNWHDKHGAKWEPVGHWLRPYCYVQKGESVKQAVFREVTACRNKVGVLDASTLGKIMVRGKDSGKFLDMIYTNMMSNLKLGKCRYGLICSENGFLIDDGVVARIDENSYLCHTTSGGAENIHSMMEEWLQTEWWDFEVYVTNVTEQFSQITVVGENARRVLEKLGCSKICSDSLPFMGWVDEKVFGVDVRVYRISFSGELSFEISVPSNKGLFLWNEILSLEKEFGITPYGTEALHVMRAEKGFIMIGDETDGTVIPQDLGLDWALSKKKNDYIGKRAHQRLYMSNPERWKLVGLESTDGSVIPEGAYAIGLGENEVGQKVTIGRVTSTYYSPTLKKGIALGLVAYGPDRLGETIQFPTLTNSVVEAKIVSPIFYDPDGFKQNV